MLKQAALLTLASCTLLTACSLTPEKQNNNISFLAFGDGGYHPDYPKAKHIHNPKNKAQFIADERADAWAHSALVRKGVRLKLEILD